jgi:hypothetical protein
MAWLPTDSHRPIESVGDRRAQTDTLPSGSRHPDADRPVRAVPHVIGGTESGRTPAAGPLLRIDRARSPAGGFR